MTADVGAAVNITYHTDVFAQYGDEAEAQIGKVIEQNEIEAQVKTASR
jgi:membrane fusion protein, multidrug efflux system